MKVKVLNLKVELIFLLTFLFCSLTAYADEDLDTERGYKQIVQEVFIGEVVYPQERGEIQFTVAPQFRDNDSEQLLEFPITLEYGITDSWQLELEWVAYARIFPEDDRNKNGIGDLELGTKYSFMNIGGSDFHTALGFEIGFPTGDIDDDISQSEGFIEFEPFIVLAKDLPRLKDSHLFTQVGFSYSNKIRNTEENAGDSDNSFGLLVNAGYIFPIYDFRLTTEFNYEGEWNGGEREDEIFITPGLILVAGDWEFGFGVAAGLSEDSDNYRLIGMITYEFNILGYD